MKVLGLSSYPIESAATRFRLAQFVEPLREHNIEISLNTFLSSKQFRELYSAKGLPRKALAMLPSVFRRITETFRLQKYDLILVQREAMLFGPAIFEWLYQTVGKLPLVLDLDDATYISYVSPSYGKVGSFLKAFGKTDELIKRADLVVCGNRFIAEHVAEIGSEAVIIPTIADPKQFTPAEKKNDKTVIGWIGTHSTFPFLTSLVPVFERLAAKHSFTLKIVGAETDPPAINGLEIVNLDWSLEREIKDFRSLDIGVYPITVTDSASEGWLKGKSGFKAIQYLAVGVPFVMSPVGICAEVGVPGKTHFNASNDDEWYHSLDKLLSDAKLRETMGSHGRQHSVENYSVTPHAATLAEALKRVGDK
ncbi:MAG: glycosyltransferase family 4 protein [Pyrinomonadaceae bacterium]